MSAMRLAIHRLAIDSWRPTIVGPRDPNPCRAGT